jgi:hypothetical protein
LVRLKLDEDIHIAVRPEVLTEHRAEEGEFADVMSVAEVGNVLPIDGNLWTHLVVLLSP